MYLILQSNKIIINDEYTYYSDTDYFDNVLYNFFDRRCEICCTD